MTASVAPSTASSGQQKKDGSRSSFAWAWRRGGGLAGLGGSGASGGASWYWSASAVLPAWAWQVGQTGGSPGCSNAEDISAPHLGQDEPDMSALPQKA